MNRTLSADTPPLLNEPKYDIIILGVVMKSSYHVSELLKIDGLGTEPK
jgi:hypothetical protein